MSPPPPAARAGLRRTCTVVQISRGSSRRQILVRITIGGRAHDGPEATCAKKRTCSPTGRASILKKGLVSHDFPSLKESCLIWGITVRQRWGLGLPLDPRPVPGPPTATLRLPRCRARALAVADVVPSLQHRLVRASQPVTLLDGDAADRLADGVLDDADAQRLQLAVELTRDPPLPQQLRWYGRIVREELRKDWLGRSLRRCRG